jgi:sterol desaturase/sphingolipid hydroxylase (fatty acid hydroxylase superfamily)
MTTSEFLTGVVFLLAAMAVAAAIELAVPLYASRRPAPGRRAANLGMTVQTVLFSFGLTTVTALVAAAVPLSSPSWMRRAGLPMAAQLVVGIMALDFAFGYVAHRTMHASPRLWRFHRVHHSDPFVDVTTSYRTHPVENAWRHLWMVSTIWLLGVPASVLVVYRAMSVVNGVLEHANIRVNAGLDTRLSRVWVTPNMHKVHHSRDQRETDTNYGNLLSLYDRLLGTFTPTAKAFSVTYGLDDADPEGRQTVAGLLAMPFRGAERPRATIAAARGNAR